MDLHIGLEHFSVWIEVRLTFKSSCESRARKEKNVCDAHNLNAKSARLKSVSSTCFACENLTRADPGISERGVVLL